MEKAKKSATRKPQAIDSVFEEFFQDYFARRKKIYWLNFMRGIFFGLGTFIGGTFVIAAVLWLLSIFGQIPFLSDIIQSIQSSLDDARIRRGF